MYCRATRLAWHYEGERTGPKCLTKPRRHRIKDTKAAGCGRVVDMCDQRVEGRPTLGIVQASDGLAVGGVGSKAIDGFRRERDQAARSKATDGLGQRLCGYRHDAR